MIKWLDSLTTNQRVNLGVLSCIAIVTLHFLAWDFILGCTITITIVGIIIWTVGTWLIEDDAEEDPHL